MSSDLSFYNLWFQCEPSTKQLSWSEALLNLSKTPGEAGSRLQTRGPKLVGLKGEGPKARISMCALLSLEMYGMRSRVCFRLGGGAVGRAYFESWSRGLAPRISGRLFFCCTIPWEMRSWKLRGGKWVEKGEARGKGGVPAITLLTSQFSTVACPAHLS